MGTGRVGTVERDGARTVYEVHGRPGAPALLFGHAQILSRAQYAPQVEAFAGRYRVIALDFRGHGESPVSPAPYRMEDLAQDAVAVLDAEGIGRAHYLGSSLGGMVGFALALEHAPRLASVTFLATQGVLPAANGERIRRTAARLAALGDSMAPAAAGDHGALHHRGMARGQRCEPRPPDRDRVRQPACGLRAFRRRHHGHGL